VFFFFLCVCGDEKSLRYGKISNKGVLCCYCCFVLWWSEWALRTQHLFLVFVGNALCFFFTAYSPLKAQKVLHCGERCAPQRMENEEQTEKHVKK
jgi:hypothetical protein